MITTTAGPLEYNIKWRSNKGPQLMTADNIVQLYHDRAETPMSDKSVGCVSFCNGRFRQTLMRIE
jgi:hypothetical protein